MGDRRPLLAMPGWSDKATIDFAESSGWEVGKRGTPENLQKMQPTLRGQTVGIDGGAVLTLDRGEPAPFNTVSLLYTNLTEEASWRVTAANTIPALDVGPRSDTSQSFGAGIRFYGDGQTAAASHAGWNVLTSFSLSVRCRPDAIRRQGIVSLSPDSGTAAWLSMFDDGRIRFMGLPGLGVNLISPTAIPLGEFRRITGTYNQGTGTCQLLIDGQVVASQAGVGAFVPNPEHIVLADVEQDSFEGILDDVRIWDHARSAAQEVATLDEELAGSESGLVAYWKCNEKQGLSASNEKSGPALALQGAPAPYWSFPERFWASPNLDGWPRRHSFYFDPVGHLYRYVRIELLDPNNPTGFLHAGRLYISDALWMSRGLRFGSRPLDRIDPSERTQMPSGATFVRRIPSRAAMNFRVGSTDETEVKRYLSDVQRARAASRDVLWVLEPMSEEWRHASMLYGLASEFGIPASNYGLWETEQTLEELI